MANNNVIDPLIDDPEQHQAPRARPIHVDEEEPIQNEAAPAALPDQDA